MLMLVINVVSFLILLAWLAFLLIVIAFIVMAVIEFGRALAVLIAAGFRRLTRAWGRASARRTDARFLRQVGTRR